MSFHLQKEVLRLKRQLLELCGQVEANVGDAIQALQRRDERLAAQVAMREQDADAREVDIEEECLKALALYQPVAVDLRYVIGVLKINQDLERISDISRHIADRAMEIVRGEPIPLTLDVTLMAEKVRLMLRQSLDAFVTLDVNKAREVCFADDEVDRLHRHFCQELTRSIRQYPEHAEALLQLMHISRHLERIGDHATNIAEDLIYMVEGRIVRHRMTPGTASDR